MGTFSNTDIILFFIRPFTSSNYVPTLEKYCLMLYVVEFSTPIRLRIVLLLCQPLI